MVLITFSMELDKQMQINQVKWYTTEFLINLLVENLKKVNFEPTTIKIETDYWQFIWLPIVCVFTIVILYKKPIASIIRLFI